MLAIGRALVTNPRLLVMDEPSEGLAPAIIENMIETFQQARAGGPRAPADRAEPRRRDRARGAPADHGRRQDRGRDDRRGALRRSGAAAALPRRGAARQLGFPALASPRPIVTARSILAAGAVVCLLLVSGCGAPARPVTTSSSSARETPTTRSTAWTPNGSRQGRLTDEGGRPLDRRAGSVPDRIRRGRRTGRRSRSRARARDRSTSTSMNADGTGTRRADVLERRTTRPDVVAGRQPDRVLAVERRRPRLGDERRRDRRATPDGRARGRRASPSWSPDGRWIAYYAPRVRERRSARSGSCTPTARGGIGVTSLGAKSLRARRGRPTRSTLAFSANPDSGRYEIYTIGVDGKGLRRLTSAPRPTRSSPRGRRTAAR